MNKNDVRLLDANLFEKEMAKLEAFGDEFERLATTRDQRKLVEAYKEFVGEVKQEAHQKGFKNEGNAIERRGETRTVEERLKKIEAMLVVLVERQMIKDFYDVDEFARLVGKAPFTVREWCRLGRIRADKRRSGRGAFASWTIAHNEFVRYQKEGLLPGPSTTTRLN